MAPGDIFVAIKGETHDGHDFVAAALKAGAGLAIVSRADATRCGRRGRCWSSAMIRCAALEDMGRAARARSQAQIIAVTGSVGKTSTKEMLRVALVRIGPDPCLGRVLQQSLGRAADAGAHAARCRLSACSRSA